MLNRFYSVIFLLLLASCAATLPYATNYPLTQQYFHSSDGSFYGKIPSGWFASTDDTVGKSLTVWLLKEDLSATLTVRELKLDRLSAQKVNKEGISLLAQISVGFHRENTQGTKIEPFEFELRDKRFCSYEILSDAHRVRIVVFSVKGKFFECEACSLKGELSPMELDRLFTVQQTVLASFDS